MEQRPLRLGDIVDDYCPRERRITNHAVVVMTGDDIAQTRCAACDAEHPYKHGKTPARKKKDGSALYDEVLAGVLKPKHVVHEVTDAVEVVAEAVAQAEVAVMDALPAPAPAPAPEPEPEPEPVAAAWGHRPLIRAQLPRIDGQLPVVPRALPEFTVRQQGSRGYGQPGHSNGHSNGQSRRGQGGQGQGHNNQRNGQGNGHGGGQGRGGRDQNGRPQGRSRHSR